MLPVVALYSENANPQPPGHSVVLVDLGRDVHQKKMVTVVENPVLAHLFGPHGFSLPFWKTALFTPGPAPSHLFCVLPTVI